MKSKLLALAILVGSFAFMPQEGVAGRCECGGGPAKNNEKIDQQICSEDGGYVYVSSAGGMTLRPGQCFLDCHCNASHKCIGADLDPSKGNTLPGKCQ